MENLIVVGLRKVQSLCNWRGNYFHQNAIIPVIALLVCQFPLNAQPPANLRQTLKYFNEACRLYNLVETTDENDARALQYFLWVANSTDPKLKTDYKVESLIKAGNIHQGYERYPQSQMLYHRALSENNKNPNPALEYEANLYLGSSLYFNGILDSAKHYFEATAEIAENYRHKVYLPELDRLYNSLGAIYYEGANYRQAKNYFELGLELAQKRNIDYNNYYVTLKCNIANCLLKINNYDSAIQIFRSLRPDPGQIGIVRQNLAHAYFEKGVYDSALALYQTTPLSGGLYKIYALNDIGRIYMGKQQYKEALLFLDSALNQNKLLTGNLKNREGALSFFYKAELAQMQHKTDEAIALSNRALREVHLDFKSYQVLDLPADVSKSLSPIVFYRILVYKAGLIYKKYLQTKKPVWLKASLQTYVKAFETANFISKNFDNDDAKILFVGNAKANYERALEVGYEACKIDPNAHQQVLYILESYKGNIIRQNLEYNKLISKAGIPDSIIKREYELKGLYAAYLTKLNLATNEHEAKQLQTRLSSVMVELSGMHRSYEKFESYYSLMQKLDEVSIPIQNIQSTIGKNLAILNYFVADTFVYIFVLTKNEAVFNREKISREFLHAISSYLSGSLRIAEGQRFTGHTASSIIFRHLLGTIYPSVKNLEYLVIIPDSYLFYLPFDALTKSPIKKDYLLYSHTVSYHYSITLFLEKLNKPVSLEHNDSTLAFAPFSGAISGRQPYPDYLTLPYSSMEIDNVSSRKLLGAMATKEQFIQNYNRYNILHLATHASLGKDSSSNWIQFYPDSSSPSAGRLFVHEIYNMKFSFHELVILSACESGSGLAVGGEGLMSISRAFMYSGTDGIISTLYKTDDRVTAFLMKRLFFYLGKGVSPEVALRKSKIDLLESDEINLRFKTPNYWGNFIYVGKVTPHKKSAWIPVLLVSTLTIIIGFIVAQKKSGKKPA